MSYNRDTGFYEGYIYKITDATNQKEYIGQTRQTVALRWKAHLRLAKSKSTHPMMLYAAMKSHGVENFSILELKKVQTKTRTDLKELLNFLEIDYIAQYQTLKPNGYNMTAGGQSRGNTFPSKPVCQYTIDGTLIRTFPSLSEAAEVVGVSEADISACCNLKKVYQVGGYRWAFKGKALEQRKFSGRRAVPNDAKPIYQFSLDGTLIAHFSCLDEAVTSAFGVDELFNYHKTKICIARTGNTHKSGYVNHVYGGFLWSESDVSPKYISHDNATFRSVQKISRDGTIINTYKSIAEAAREIGVDRSVIKRHLSSGRLIDGEYRLL